MKIEQLNCKNITVATKYLEAVNGRVRNLERSDLEQANKVFNRFKRLYPDHFITVDIRGGAVPGCYKYGATCTVACRSQDGWIVARDKAPIRPNASAPKMVVVVHNTSTKKNLKGFGAARQMSNHLVYHSDLRA